MEFKCGILLELHEKKRKTAKKTTAKKTAKKKSKEAKVEENTNDEVSV